MESNKEKIKVSVIIPIYNAERYLRECLDSVISQTLKKIEIICINDGSTDTTQLILQEYQKRDKRIRVITQNNMGAGTARNVGLLEAQGEYVIFLDSDDYFEKKMLKKALKKAVKTSADIVVFTSDTFDESTRKRERRDWGLQERYLKNVKEPFSYADMPDYIFNFSNGWAWDKLYNREFVLNNKLKFQNLRTTNDLYFVFTAFVKAKRIVTLNKVYVHQRINLSKSLSATRRKSWKCFYFALSDLKMTLENMQCYDILEQSFINFAVNFSLETLEAMDKNSYYEMYELLKNVLLEEINIKDRESDYFYNKNIRKRLNQIMDHSAEDYIWLNFFYGLKALNEIEEIKQSKTYKLVRRLGFVKNRFYNVIKLAGCKIGRGIFR